MSATESGAGQRSAMPVDAVIIGGGAAGLNGALMLARSRRSVVVVDGGDPRNAPAEGVHGLLGLDGIAPAELLHRGREEVRRYGGQIVDGEVASAAPTAPTADGDLRFTVELADGSVLHARRLLVATGLRDVLPDIPGLAEHWGRGLVHCPYCHGWEVRDEPIGVLATGPMSPHQVQLFRQLTDDLVYFARGTGLDPDTRTRFAARGVTVVDTPIAAVESDANTITGVRLVDGQVLPRRVLAVTTTMQARTAGLEDLGLPMEDLPNGMGRRFVSGLAGTTSVPGVWVAGNATELHAQVGASAAAGALAGSHINADLAAADTAAALLTVPAAPVPAPLSAAPRVDDAREPFSHASEAALTERLLGTRRHGLDILLRSHRRDADDSRPAAGRSPESAGVVECRTSELQHGFSTATRGRPDGARTPPGSTRSAS